MNGSEKIGAVAVIGGGIAGIQASLDLAEMGLKVYLVEEKPSIGGVMAQLDKTFPTNDCSMCMISPKLVETGRHLNIEILSYADLMKVEGEAGNFKAFTTTFEDLHGLKQLPGHAVQRLMAEGYGFGAEGDWKTAALVRAMKVMSTGLEGGTSFMEDYTYHMDPAGMKVLGAHMLEVCPSIAEGKSSMEVHELGIGDKDDPIRLVFDVAMGQGINVSIMDMGDRFRMLINPCQVVQADEPLPNLPVARVVWMPEPDLSTAAEAWIHAGGAH
ncbi:hypothetical protein LCGC14_3152860, partial [marine sediment metagenome]